MKSFKSHYEEFTFKVDVEGLPDMFMKGNSPGSVKAHLRKLVKQPSMIKSVDRMTKHDVKKTYRAKAQGKEVAEAVDSTDTGGEEEVNMAMKQVKAMKHFLDGIEARVKKTGDMEEWYQNKLTKANDYLKTLYSYGKGDIDENTISELSPDTVKSYKKAASKSNYSAAQKYARVAASPTGRKYKNKEMGKQDDIMRKRKAGLAMADKKKVDEQLDERTPIKPVVVDRKQKNLKVPNPNFKGLLKRKEKRKRDLYKEGESGQVDYGSDKSVKIMKDMTPGQNESKDMPAREYDYEGEMTKQQLRTIEMASKELQSMISDDQNLPEWWQNKITLAADYMQTARDYLKSDVKEEKKPIQWPSQPLPEACWDGYKQVGTKMKGGKSVPNCVPEDCGCENCKAKRMKNEKLTIGKIRRAAYKTGKALGDVQAVKKNKVARRVKNRIVGKMAAKALSGLFK